MSVDSGLSGPVEGPVPSATPRAGTPPRVAQSRSTRRGPAAADALADAVSTPSFRTGRGRPRRRGRRVTRIVRRIELWSVLKIALVFNTILLGVVLGAVALLWGLANTTGLVDDLEGFLRDAGFEDFRFQGERMFEQVAFIGAVGALAATVLMVLATALLNLISEITGGIRFVVIEEIVETPAASAPARPPSPLALPTVPPTAPSIAAPVAPAPAVTDPAPASGEGPASKDAAAFTTRRPSLAKGPSGSGRPSSTRPRSRSGGGSSRPAAKPGSGSGGTAGARRVRRQAERPPSGDDARATADEDAPAGDPPFDGAADDADTDDTTS